MALFSGLGARSIQAKLQLYKDDDEEGHDLFYDDNFDGDLGDDMIKLLKLLLSKDLTEKVSQAFSTSLDLGPVEYL